MAACRVGSLFCLSGAVLLSVVFESAVAVDRSKFRTCEQGSFCRRFKKWTQRPQRNDALWSVLPDTRTATPGTGDFVFQVKHASEAAAHLALTFSVYASGMVRMRVNEIEPLQPRHVIPAGDVVVEPPPQAASDVKIGDEPGATVFTFKSSAGSTIVAKLKHSPLGLEVAADGRVLQTVNARNYFNFERYRKPKEVLPPDSANAASPEQVVMDAAAHPHGLDTTGLWEEDFGGHTDKKPRGPASLGMDVTFEGNVPSLFGLPEHMTKASLPFYEEPYRFFNLDVFEYENNEPMALYGAVPLLWAIHRGKSSDDAMASAFLWLNPSETFVKLERDAESGGLLAGAASALGFGKGEPSGPAHAWWTSESGVMDVVVLVGPAPAQVSLQYHTLTGFAPLPPMWALGKHQCRWNYMNEKDVATVDASYDKFDIPYDVIWLDIEHTDGKAYFTWHPTNFPTPQKMIDAISSKRRMFVNVVDPHIKKQENFHVYTEIRDKGLFIKQVDQKMMDDPSDAKPADWDQAEQIRDTTAVKPDEWNEEEDGAWEQPLIANPEYKGEWKTKQIVNPNSPLKDFEGWCWPGTSLYPDFTDPKMREYWGSQFALDKYAGTNKDVYIWNDMNEPSVFNGPEVTMPRDAIHPNGNVEHRDVHNMYGYYVHRATFEGLEARTPDDRAFVLTRSFFSGSHRYAAIWTGDNTATWEHLETSIPMIGALTLGGISLSGADVGGFFKHPDSEMVTRWYQLGIFAYPFLRNHAHLETPRREPYMYDEATMVLVKAALQLRYKMLPLWYTVFQEYHGQGKPVVRPLFWDFLADPVTHADPEAVENEIMLGDSVLVHSVYKPLAEAKSVKVYLPLSAGWYDLHTGAFSPPGHYDLPVTLNTIPAYYRAGRIVPLKTRVRRSSTCMHMDPHSLSVYLDPATSSATGTLYIDDYKTKQYQDGKSFLHVVFRFENGVLKAVSKRGDPPAEISTEVERVEIFGLEKAPTSAVLKVDGKAVQLAAPAVKQVEAGPKGKALFSASVKIMPWLDLRSEWSVEVS